MTGDDLVARPFGALRFAQRQIGFLPTCSNPRVYFEGSNLVCIDI
ncbi:hypothetical protein [Thioalkalivibrio sulfidiphilus]